MLSFVERINFCSQFRFRFRGRVSRVHNKTLLTVFGAEVVVLVHIHRRIMTENEITVLVILIFKKC